MYMDFFVLCEFFYVLWVVDENVGRWLNPTILRSFKTTTKSLVRVNSHWLVVLKMELFLVLFLFFL